MQKSSSTRIGRSEKIGIRVINDLQRIMFRKVIYQEFQACSEKGERRWQLPFLRASVVLLHLLLIACFATAQQTGLDCTLYVDAFASQTSSNDGRSLAQAFRTIQQAVNVASPGDTICIRAGRYPAVVLSNLRGTAQAWITFTGYPGDARPVLDPALPGRNLYHGTIHMVGTCEYLIFDGLEITSSNSRMDQIRSLDISTQAGLDAFEYEITSGPAADELNYGHAFRFSRSSSAPAHNHLIFRNNEIHRIFRHAFLGGGNDMKFINNEVFDLGKPMIAYGWYHNGSRALFQGNLVHDMTMAFHLYPEARSDTIIENNMLYNLGGLYYHQTARVARTLGSAILFWSGGERNSIRNNTIFDSLNGISLSKASGAVIANNTIVSVSEYGLLLYSSAVSPKVHNNIIHRAGITLFNESSSAVVNNNLFDSSIAGNFVGDPLFIDETNSNPRNRSYQLAGGNNPAIDRGLSLVFRDINGNLITPSDQYGTTRPQGDAWDIGADEYSDQPDNPPPPPPPGGDLLSYWSFNDSTARDEVGDNHGTRVGATFDNSGKEGSALGFDGIDDYLNTSTWNITGEQLTIAAWIKAEDFGVHDGRILSKARGVAEQEHDFMLSTISNSGIKLRFRLKTNGVTSTLISNGASLTVGQWVHVAAVYNGSSMLLYQNGSLVGSLAKSGSISTSNSMVWLGNNPPYADRAFDGLIDEVRVYQNALSASEINALINSQPPEDRMPPAAPTNLHLEY